MIKQVDKVVWDITYTLTIDYDDYDESPRENDNLWTLVTAHRNYAWDEELPEDCESLEDAFIEHLDDKWLTMDQVYYHRVWLMDHLWLSVRTSPFWCQWYSGQWGYIYVSHDRYKEECIPVEWETDEQSALKYLDGEIETLNRYYSWEIYRFSISAVKKKMIDWEEYTGDLEHIDSCGWFYDTKEMCGHQNIFEKEDFII